MACETGAGPFEGRRILIVEDEYYIAADLKSAIVALGAVVLGPTGDLAQALDLAGSGQVDAALLDINLAGERSFGVAERLDARHVPYLFLTGYDEWALPERFRTIPRLAKPAEVSSVLRAMDALLRAEPAG